MQYRLVMFVVDGTYIPLYPTYNPISSIWVHPNKESRSQGVQ